MKSNIFYDKYDELTSSEKYINRYILDNMESVVKMSITKLSLTTFVSIGTITNYSKKLGLNGWKELVFTIKEILEAEKNKLEKTNESVIDDIKHEVMETISLNSEITYNKICNFMIKANQICFFGLGLSSKVFDAIKNNFKYLLETKVVFIDDHVVMNKLANHLGANDVVIFLTQSGRHEVLKIISAKLKTKNVNVVLITNNKESEVIANATFCLFTKNQTHGPLTMNTRTTQLLVLEIISKMLEKKIV